MQLLVAWLSRRYDVYSSSSTKVEMLEELCQGMRVAGYPRCTVCAIRSKIDAMRRETRSERLGDHRHSRAFQEYQQSLMSIFAADGDARQLDTSDTETDEESTASRVEVKPESAIQDGSRNSPFVVGDAENNGDQGAGVGFDAGARRQRRSTPLDVAEIQRRFQLVCARHGLEQRGVATEIIDRLFPLPDE
jgi:hypothetical protein